MTREADVQAEVISGSTLSRRRAEWSEDQRRNFWQQERRHLGYTPSTWGSSTHRSSVSLTKRKAGLSPTVTALDDRGERRMPLTELK